MQAVLRSLNAEERTAVEQMQIRFKEKLPPKLEGDPILFYRFLKARDFDVNKAEAMLNKHINWRKAHQIDTILETFNPKEAFKFLASHTIGYDKEGNLVKYAASGRMDIKDVTRAFKVNDYLKHFMWMVKMDDKLGKENNEKTGLDAFQGILIFNLDGCPLSNITATASAEVMIRISLMLQDNFPERVKAQYVINAPAYFTLLFSVLKKVMSNAMINKTHVYGQRGWKEALLKEIDADVLPAFLGGNRRDPDGNPKCCTFLYHGGKLDPKYYLPDEERQFKDPSKVTRATLAPKEVLKVPVDVKKRDSLIEWEFQIKHKDIGFGLFYRISGLELDEKLPVERIATVDGTERGTFPAQNTGTYIILFDNTHSWWNSKEIEYCITVKE